MREYTTKMMETEIPVKAICNMTEKEINLAEDMNYIEINRLHNFTVNFSYGSDFDMGEWSFDLDEDALLNIIKTFKVKPDGFASDAKHPNEVFEEWKRTGEVNWKAGWTQEELNKEEKKLEVHREKMKGVRDMFATFKKIKNGTYEKEQ